MFICDASVIFKLLSKDHVMPPFLNFAEAQIWITMKSRLSDSLWSFNTWFHIILAKSPVEGILLCSLHRSLYKRSLATVIFMKMRTWERLKKYLLCKSGVYWTNLPLLYLEQSSRKKNHECNGLEKSSNRDTSISWGLPGFWDLTRACTTSHSTIEETLTPRVICQFCGHYTHMGSSPEYENYLYSFGRTPGQPFQRFP